MMSDNQQDNALPWEDFEMGDAETENKKAGFALIAPNLYVVECLEIKRTLGKKYKSEETQPQFTWTFQLKKAIDGSALIDVEGKELQFDRFPVWSQLNQTRVVKGQPQLTRAIMTSLLGLPANAAMPTAKDPTMFIGKQCKLLIELGEKEDGTPKNIMQKFMPIMQAATPAVLPDTNTPTDVETNV